MRVSGSSAVPVVETLGLVPSTITMSYRPQRADGTLDAAISFTLICSRKWIRQVQ